ncbi:MAG: hydrolase, partial [Desulfopila sp.]
LIQAQASPFVTLIHFPGHIGLYLGELDGEPVILHSIWGHRTQKSGQEGRHIIGQTVITTLKAGSGLHPKRPNGLIDSATGLTHLHKGVTHGE